MAFLSFKNIAISGISACVPKNVVKNNDFKDLINEQALEKIIKTTGIAERRIVDEDTCSSDLCFKAVSRLLDEMDIDRKTIDMLIFVTQTPDFRLPASAVILQHRLGLPKSVGAFDINLGCSGYVYGLSMAFSYASQEGISRVLLLVGDTASKFISLKDKTTALLFGDCGTATLIEKRCNAGKSYFSLNTDGAGEGVLKIRGGGYRFPSSIETLTENICEDGNIRNDEQLFMDGAEIFNFAVRDVALDIDAILKYSGDNLDSINAIIYHQANKFIIDYLTKKLKFPIQRVPSSLSKFGNTSSASIPLTIVSEFKGGFKHSRNKVILCGFGVGFSWATSLLDLSNCYISDLIEA